MLWLVSLLSGNLTFQENKERRPRYLYLRLVMLFAFLECNFLYRIKKTYTLFAHICEQFREKQSNKFGLKTLKLDPCPGNLFEYELRKGRPPPISWRHNLLLTSERLKKNIPPLWPVSFINSHWNKLRVHL